MDRFREIHNLLTRKLNINWIYFVGAYKSFMDTQKKFHLKHAQ